MPSQQNMSSSSVNSPDISVEEANKALVDSGMENLTRFWGSEEKRDEYVNRLPEVARDYVIKGSFQGLWSRPGLEWREKSIVIISVLAATSLTEPLFSHVQAGLRNGLTEEEVNEVLLMVMGYTGFPRGLQAFKAAEAAMSAARDEREQTHAKETESQ